MSLIPIFSDEYFTFKKYSISTIIIFTIFLFFVTISFTCSSPTSPKQNPPPDTTSNNFIFQKFTFGASNAGSSHLSDVAIVSDTDIWCVGAVYLDSANGAPDPNAYNVVHWDGSKWDLKRIKTNACGGVVYPPIQTVFAFSSNDILFAHIDGSITHYDGIQFTNDCSLIIQLNGSANKIWGKTSKDFYVVSGNGFIAHYQNGSWQKIESGTDMNIYDIWGEVNSQTGNEEILAVASYPDTSAQRKILQINGTSVKEISTKGINWDLESVWFKPGSQYYVAGSGIYQRNLLSDSLWRNSPRDITKYYTNSIRGNDINDVVAVGSFGEVIHYNGVRWKSFINQTGLTNGEYLSVAIKDNEIVAVGYNGAKAVILIGKR